jgi:beta-glucosidase-like glycosyl hydrolase
MKEHFRFDMSVEIDDKTLREVYFRPFQRAIEVSQPPKQSIKDKVTNSAFRFRVVKRQAWCV